MNQMGTNTIDNKLETGGLAASWLAGLIDSSRAVGKGVFTTSQKGTTKSKFEFKDKGRYAIGILPIQDLAEDYQSDPDAAAHGSHQIRIQIEMEKPKHLVVTSSKNAMSFVVSRLEKSMEHYLGVLTGKPALLEKGSSKTVQYYRKPPFYFDTNAEKVYVKDTKQNKHLDPLEEWEKAKVLEVIASTYSLLKGSDHRLPLMRMISGFTGVSIPQEALDAIAAEQREAELLAEVAQAEAAAMNTGSSSSTGSAETSGFVILEPSELVGK